MRIKKDQELNPATQYFFKEAGFIPMRKIMTNDNIITQNMPDAAF
jgi:hypothetical protein